MVLCFIFSAHANINIFQIYDSIPSFFLFAVHSRLFRSRSSLAPAKARNTDGVSLVPAGSYQSGVRNQSIVNSGSILWTPFIDHRFVHSTATRSTNPWVLGNRQRNSGFGSFPHGRETFCNTDTSSKYCPIRMWGLLQRFFEAGTLAPIVEFAHASTFFVYDVQRFSFVAFYVLVQCSFSAVENFVRDFSKHPNIPLMTNFRRLPEA